MPYDACISLFVPAVRNAHQTQRCCFLLQSHELSIEQFFHSLRVSDLNLRPFSRFRTKLIGPPPIHDTAPHNLVSYTSPPTSYILYIHPPMNYHTHCTPKLVLTVSSLVTQSVPEPNVHVLGFHVTMMLFGNRPPPPAPHHGIHNVFPGGHSLAIPQSQPYPSLQHHCPSSISPSPNHTLWANHWAGPDHGRPSQWASLINPPRRPPPPDTHCLYIRQPRAIRSPRRPRNLPPPARIRSPAATQPQRPARPSGSNWYHSGENCWCVPP